MARPRLLYVTPKTPALTGSGMAMRSGMQILALSEMFEVSVAIVVVGQTEVETRLAIPPELHAACSSISVVAVEPLFDRLMKQAPGAQARLIIEAAWPLPLGLARIDPGLDRMAGIIANSHPGYHFEAIHCFRLATARILRPLRRRGLSWSRSVIDLDDYESFAKFRYVETFTATIGRQFTMLRRHEARTLRRLEDRYVPQFDDGYICSRTDQTMLLERFPSVRWLVVPNVVQTPTPMERVNSENFTFLFVGSLDFGPNQDGVLFFCSQVLPELRRIAQKPFRVMIAGREPSAQVRRLAELDGVEVIGDPPEVAPLYRRADAVIVPLLSGAGTRIKILEAFSFGLPVVSTELGAEGLDIEPGREALIANAPDAFAAECARLLVDPELRSQLVSAGSRLFQSRYNMDSLREILREAHDLPALVYQPG